MQLQLQHLTHSDVTLVVSACQVREREYVTMPSGIVERASTSTPVSYQQAYQGVRNALNALSDGAVIELQALAWYGRGDGDADFQTDLNYSRQRFDRTTRDYLYAMSPLRQYVEAGLAKSRAILRL